MRAKQRCANPFALRVYHRATIELTGAGLCATGVIPIDRLTDVRTPVAVVCQRIARAELERVYGLRLPQLDEHDAPDK